MTRPTVRRRLLSLALAAAFTGPVLAQNYEPFTVADIRVDGLQRISAGTVFSYLPVKVGLGLAAAALALISATPALAPASLI